MTDGQRLIPVPMRTQTEPIWDSRSRRAGRRLDNGQQGILLTDFPVYADRVRSVWTGKPKQSAPDLSEPLAKFSSVRKGRIPCFRPRMFATGAAQICGKQWTLMCARTKPRMNFIIFLRNLHQMRLQSVR